jgi:hypothetical protein
MSSARGVNMRACFFRFFRVARTAATISEESEGRLRGAARSISDDLDLFFAASAWLDSLDNEAARRQ